MTSKFDENMKLITDGIQDISKMLDDERARANYYRTRFFMMEKQYKKLEKSAGEVVKAWRMLNSHHEPDCLLELAQLLEGDEDDNTDK